MNIKNAPVVRFTIMQFFNVFVNLVKKVMEKKIVYSCSCFIDQSFWFVNSMYHSWKFDSFVCVNGSVSNNLFIYEKEFTFVLDFDGNNVQ